MKKNMTKYAKGFKIGLSALVIALFTIGFANASNTTNESLSQTAVNGVLSSAEESKSLPEQAVESIRFAAEYTGVSEQLDVIDQKLRYMNAVRIANENEMFDKVLNQRNMDSFLFGSKVEKLEYEQMVSILENIDEKKNQE